MLDLLNPRLTNYLLSKKHSVEKYIYSKPPTYNTSPIGSCLFIFYYVLLKIAYFSERFEYSAELDGSNLELNFDGRFSETFQEITSEKFTLNYRFSNSFSSGKCIFRIFYRELLIWLLSSTFCSRIVTVTVGCVQGIWRTKTRMLN